MLAQFHLDATFRVGIRPSFSGKISLFVFFSNSALTEPPPGGIQKLYAQRDA